jgi:hypothetical protein
MRRRQRPFLIAPHYGSAGAESRPLHGATTNPRLTFRPGWASFRKKADPSNGRRESGHQCASPVGVRSTSCRFFCSKDV